ncbi:MAG: hypothetical protein IT381_27480 [Deltaproteobacteria bacterium]|nr:hypothetical protein [Deltaproteobacteria bacterium]
MLLLLALLLASEAAPPPPSTGKEAPQAAAPKLPTEAEARAMLAKVVAAAKPATRDCKTLIAPWTRVLLALARPEAAEVKKNSEGYLWLARCAEKQKYYVLLGDIGALMLASDPKGGHPELLARAYVGLNSPRLALGLLDKAQKFAAKDPDVALTRAKVFCRVRDWKQCLAAAEQTVKLGAKLKGPAKNEVLNRAHKYRARALLHTGKLPEAAKAVAESDKLGGDAEDLIEVRKSLVPAKAYGALVETEHMPMVALGIFHLIGKHEGSKPLVRVYLDNVGEDRQFRIEASIDGVTQVQTKTETVLKGQSIVADLTPPLAATFDLVGMRAARRAQLSIRVLSVAQTTEAVVHQDSEEIELQPRDFLPTAAFVDEEKAMAENLNMFMAAWVTPTAKAVEAFLAEAKTRAPRNTFAGEQSATIPQVQAIYDSLKAKGVSYVMNPETASGNGYGQRARLPAEVLATTNAQCLEGAILYATLMEAIGLQPAIVLVPGHAFVGWHATEQDDPKLKDKYLFLETTMTHDAPFEAAMKVGLAEFDEAFAKKKARVLMLPALRKAGIAPQPYD